MKVKLIIIIALFCLLLGCDYYEHNYSHISNKELSSVFAKEKNDFNRLVSMFNEDVKGKSDDFYVKREPNFPTFESLSKERQQEYTDLMKKLNIFTIGKIKETQEIRLVVFSDAKAAGIDELEADLVCLVFSPEKTLSSFWDSEYKKIDENWYIFHTTTSGKPE